MCKEARRTGSKAGQGSLALRLRPCLPNASADKQDAAAFNLRCLIAVSGFGVRPPP